MKTLIRNFCLLSLALAIMACGETSVHPVEDPPVVDDPINPEAISSALIEDQIGSIWRLTTITYETHGTVQIPPEQLFTFQLIPRWEHNSPEYIRVLGHAGTHPYEAQFVGSSSEDDKDAFLKGEGGHARFSRYSPIDTEDPIVRGSIEDHYMRVLSQVRGYTIFNNGTLLEFYTDRAKLTRKSLTFQKIDLSNSAEMKLELIDNINAFSDELYTDRIVNIDNINVENNMLTMNVQYYGGCSNHGFRLISGQAFIDTDPAEMAVYLVRWDVPDDCHMLVTIRLACDISGLKAKYQEEFLKDPEGDVLLKVHGVHNSPRSHTFQFR